MQGEQQKSKSLAYSCAELAGMKLPGYPTSRQGWDNIVKAEKWSYVEVRSPGRGGVSRKYHPDSHVAALIEARQQGDLPPADPRPAKAPAANNDPAVAWLNSLHDKPDQPLRQRQDVKMMMATGGYSVAEPRPGTTHGEIDAPLLRRCAAACQQVHGDAFARESALTQLDYAVELYNLLVNLSAVKGRNPTDFCRLEASELNSQLHLFLQMGWLTKFLPEAGYGW